MTKNLTIRIKTNGKNKDPMHVNLDGHLHTISSIPATSPGYNINDTYTTTEAAQVLGVTVGMLHKHRTRLNPSAFVIITQGTGKRHPTRYQAAPIDRLAAYLQQRRQRFA
jgi:hypothetical protein